MQVILWGGGSACACEHMLDYINNPENILTLILHSFIRSLSNFRSCQIRPIFPILLFWSKLKNACKYVKLAIRYQIISEEVFFQHPLVQGAYKMIIWIFSLASWLVPPITPIYLHIEVYNAYNMKHKSIGSSAAK